MKNGVYLSLLGLLLVINRSNGIDDDDPPCKYDDERQLAAECFHPVDIKPYPQIYVPISNLSTEILNLTLQTINSPEWKWHVNSLDYFNRFTNLNRLSILGEMTFSSKLDKNTLRSELFNIPNLQSLFLYNNSFNSEDHLWILPSQLKNLSVFANDYTEFSVDQSPHLEELSFRLTSLTSIPQLPNPASALRKVVLLKNSLMEITVEKVASFCRANTLILDANNLLTADTCCECLKMKKWIKDVLNESETNIFNKPLNCFNNSKADCQNYTLDLAKKIRDECLEKPINVTIAIASNDNVSSNNDSWTWFYIGLATVVITVIALAAFIIGRFFTSRTPAQDGDKSYDSDDQDDEKSEEPESEF